MLKVENLLKNAREAALELAASAGADAHKKALLAIATHIQTGAPAIVAANQVDVAAEQNAAKKDRLLLNEERIEALAESVREVAELPSVLGTVAAEHRRPNGLAVRQLRVPLGVLAMVYEARPNVTVDAAALAIKSGNAVVLRGGKEAHQTNLVLCQLIADALQSAQLPATAVQLVDPPTREATAELLTARGQVDLLIPRGGRGLIDAVRRQATVPVIETGASVVHLFVDEMADVPRAAQVVLNAKTRRVSVCNALDTLLVHKSVADTFLPLLRQTFQDFEQKSGRHVRLHTCEKSRAFFPQSLPATPKDFHTEFLADEMNIRVVSGLAQATEHIRQHSLGHSEAILTGSTESAQQFAQQVDAACVFINASTAFADGGEFGLGAEMGISTQKLHARGPFAHEALTTTKWVAAGDMLTRPA